MSENFFITGIGTDVGKTYILTEIIKSLKAKQKDLAACKPVISGFDEVNIEGSDSYKILNSLGNSVINLDEIKKISPYRFIASLSPDQAADSENTVIPYDSLVDFSSSFLQINQEKDFCFIEGAGGLFVPLNENKLILDLINDLNIKIILVSNNYLGCINHTLLSLNAIAHKNVVVFFNNYPQTHNLDTNLASLRNFTKIPIYTNIEDLLSNM